MPTDPYVDPRTSVLRNLFGISDAGELAKAEARLAAAAERVLLAGGLVLGNFDLDQLWRCTDTSSVRYTTGRANCGPST